MPQPIYQPLQGNVRQDKLIPEKVHRRGLSRPVYKRRICRDNRAYAVVPFTITGTVATGDYGPMWRADRDYWVARATANVGKHDDGTHPSDGTPSGQAIRVNLRRVTDDLADDDAILQSDDRLVINPDHHQDAINNGEDGPAAEGDFAVLYLDQGDHVYVRVLQVGSGRPGTNLVVTLTLVPVP